MVAVSFRAPEVNARWLLYLALSVCVNALIVQAIKMDLPKVPLMEMASIQLNLKALSSAHLSAAQPKKNVESPTKKSVKAPVVTKGAKEKVSVKTIKPLPVSQLVKPTLQTEKQNSRPEPTVENAQEVELLDTAIEETVETATTVQDDVTQAVVASREELDVDKGESAASMIHEANYRKQTAPLYPRRAFELGQEGTVTLHAEVMTNGLPRELKVMKSSGYRLLDTAAVAAVRKWEFEPTNIDGRAIVSWVKVPVNFVIKQ